MRAAHDEYVMTIPAPNVRRLARLAALGCALPALAAAQSLHGSRASIARMYHHARAEVALWSDGPGTTPRRVWKVVR